MRLLIQIDLSKDQFGVLMNALKEAEGSFTGSRMYKGASDVSKLWMDLHKQVFTYGQVMEDEIDYEEE